jgi:hypothetical protein
MGRGHWPGCRQRSCSTNGWCSCVPGAARAPWTGAQHGGSAALPAGAQHLGAVVELAARARRSARSRAHRAVRRFGHRHPCGGGGPGAGTCTLEPGRVGAPPRPAGARERTGRPVRARLLFRLPAGVPERRKVRLLRLWLTEQARTFPPPPGARSR